MNQQLSSDTMPLVKVGYDFSEGRQMQVFAKLFQGQATISKANTLQTVPV